MAFQADVTSYGQLHGLLRQRVAALGLTRERIGAMVGLADGHAGKLLAPYPGARISLELWLAFARVAGLKMQLVEDESASVAGVVLSSGRYAPVELQDPRVLAKQALRRHLRKHARRAGKKGAAARMEKISPRRRSAIARHAVRTRWRRVRQAEREAARKARLKRQ